MRCGTPEDSCEKLGKTWGRGAGVQKVESKRCRINSILATVWHVGGWNIKI